MKKVVVLEFKDEQMAGSNPRIYKSVAELVRSEGRAIGIGLNSLWNAMSKGGGKYENRLCTIKYREVK